MTDKMGELILEQLFKMQEKMVTKEDLKNFATKDDLKHLGTVFEGRDIKEAEVKHISELFVIYKDVNIDDLILDKEEVSDAKYFKLEEIAKNNYAVRHSELFELFKKELERNN